jgi:hypothetical protein
MQNGHGITDRSMEASFSAHEAGKTQPLKKNGFYIFISKSLSSGPPNRRA